ncbi:glucose dehydrogenase [Halobacteriales archaeon QS_8_69_26]|nr:MAG: glucose dehydrogenase [Halobacteriales archaeon QS_8_69_26]
MTEGRYTRRGVLATLCAATAAGCLGAPQATDSDPPEVEEDVDIDWEPPMDTSPLAAEVTPTVLVENLEIPWDIAVAPTGELFVTERTGRVVRFAADDVSGVVEPENAIDAGSLEPGADDQPWWVEGGEGGTLGVAVHPEFPDESYVYVYYTVSVEGGKRNQVVRYDADAESPGDTREIVVDGIPAAKIHNGGRISFGPDGDLWVLTGDAGEPGRSGDPRSLGGKVLRVTPEGDPSPANPDLEAGDPRVFTYGHRNPQGIVWLPDGTPVASEHGPAGRDEVNVLYPGGNYGWDEVRDGDEGGEYGSYANHDEHVPPIVNTGPGTSWAPSGALFYTGDAVPEWRNRMLVGGLFSQQLHVLTLTPNRGAYPLPSDGHGTRFDADWMDDSFAVADHTVLENELGRIRHVEQGPDGELYAVTSNRDGRATDGFPTERDDVLVRLDAE